MKIKYTIMIALLLLIGVGLAFSLPDKADPDTPNNATAAATTSGKAVSTPDIKMESGVVAYYFHGSRRCKTCRAIESYTNEALQAGFSKAINNGSLVWQVINIDEPNHQHFIQDFQLSSSSVILVRHAKGQPKEWKNLHRVWQIVHGDKNEFIKYIQAEVKFYLETPAS